MNISSAWLREWANPNVSNETLAQDLTMAGLEVEGITPAAPVFEKVVVGHVLSCKPHSNADKLNLCEVDIAAPEHLQIICGAKNIRADLKVIVAMVGAKLPNGLKIKKTKIRGIESFGMICSQAELGISEIANGICELPDEAPLGKNIRQYLNLDDGIIELDITPNRGDCFSVLGVAREVCTIYNLPLKIPTYGVTPTIEMPINAHVSDTRACPKYLIRMIKGIDNSTPTPQWMADKLKRSGQSLYSPIVDITNFVLLELGQPLHAFDVDKINGDIKVRMAKTGEKIQLLNKTTTELQNDTLVIADDVSALAIAGVMGGIDSATQTHSRQILLESAFFTPAYIAGKARNYSLNTESSLRFERGVDFNITELAMARATSLILEICGGQASEINCYIDKDRLPILAPIRITKDKIQRVLGVILETNWIEEKFNQLGFEILEKNSDTWCILPPSFRFDIRIEADLIEELARLYGYDKLPLQKLSLDSNITAVPESIIDKNEIAKILVNRGYQEVITYSFIAEQYQNLINPKAQKINLKNPISEQLSTMRSSLWAGLLQTLQSNQRRGHIDARFFEIGLCFDGVKADEQSSKLAAVIMGNRFNPQWSVDVQAVDFFDAKADLQSLLILSDTAFSFESAQHPALQNGQTAKIFLDTEQVGWIGALSPVLYKKLSLPKCYLFEVDLVAIQQRKIPQYQSFSSYQKTTRDIALVVDKDIPAQDLVASIEGLRQKYLVDINLFDMYVGDNIAADKKSIALSLSYQSMQETLSDAKINKELNKVLTLMQTKFSAIQRE